MRDECDILERGNYAHCYTHGQTFRWRDGETCPKVRPPRYRTDSEFLVDVALALGIDPAGREWRECVLAAVRGQATQGGDRQ